MVESLIRNTAVYLVDYILIVRLFMTYTLPNIQTSDTQTDYLNNQNDSCCSKCMNGKIVALISKGSALLIDRSAIQTQIHRDRQKK
jgi:hypothetical protein